MFKKAILIMYFGVVIVGSIASVFSYGLRIWDFISFLIGIPTLIACLGFLLNKKIFVRIFWQIYFMLFIIWELVYFYVLPMPSKILSEDSVAISQYMPATLAILFYLPLFVVFYLYAFKRFDTYQTRQGRSND